MTKTKALILLALLVLFFSSAAFAAHKHLENEYQSQWCAEQHGVTEYVLDDSTRVDCLTDEYAIEFDFGPKWAEAIGQSLYYAEKTGRKPGIVLILETKTSGRYLKRLKVVAEKYNIKVWTMKPEDLSARHSRAGGNPEVSK